MDNRLLIEALVLPGGARPFRRWYRRLSSEARAAVDSRLLQVGNRNFGDHRRLKRGLVELRIHHGPGLRVYGAEWQGRFFLLAWGGSKSGQDRDIAKAVALWLAFSKSSVGTGGPHGIQD